LLPVSFYYTLYTSVYKQNVLYMENIENRKNDQGETPFVENAGQENV